MARTAMHSSRADINRHWSTNTDIIVLEQDALANFAHADRASCSTHGGPWSFLIRDSRRASACSPKAPQFGLRQTGFLQDTCKRGQRLGEWWFEWI